MELVDDRALAVKTFRKEVMFSHCICQLLIKDKSTFGWNLTSVHETE